MQDFGLGFLTKKGASKVKKNMRSDMEARGESCMLLS